MINDAFIRLWPEQASSYAVQVDWLVIAFTAMMAFFVLPVFVALWLFIFRYRRGQAADRDHRPESDLRVELTWIVLPFMAALTIFGYSALLFSRHARHRPMRWRYKSPRASGCGNSSTTAASARSIPCMFHQGARSS